MFRTLYKVLSMPSIHEHTTIQFVRFYGRWMHRKPAKVLLPFEPPTNVKLKKEKVIELDAKSTKQSDIADNLMTKKTTPHKDELKSTGKKDNVMTKKTTPHKDELKATEKKNSTQFKQVKTKSEEKLQKRKFYLSQTKVFDDNSNIIYEKLQENDGRISPLIVKLKSKKERSRMGQILVEGWRMIVDGLQSKCALKYVIFNNIEDVNNLRPFLPKTGVKFYKATYKQIELWSDVETSPGIIGIFEIPSPENFRRLSTPLPLRFICDNIRVPGNLGAILRAAVGVGCDKVLLSKGCVDVWEPKVVRSAGGAHFRLPIHYSIDWEDMPKYLEEDTSICIADSNLKMLDDEQLLNVDGLGDISIPVLPYYGLDYTTMKSITLIIGGETEGISNQSYILAAQRNGIRLNIPLNKGVDSLNTGMATAIIAFEMKKQLVQASAKLKLERKMGQIA